MRDEIEGVSKETKTDAFREGFPKYRKIGSHQPVTTVYNSKGWLTSLTDQVGAVTTFPLHNNRGLLRKKTDPLLRDTVTEYDNAGRLSYVIDRKGDRTDYTYTPTGKIDTITYQDSSTVSFTYNQHDDLTDMQDSLGSTTYVYDAAHRLTSQTDPHGFVVSYAYDEAGNLTELTYPGNKKVVYTYDELNRLETVTIDWLNPKPVAIYHYDSAGMLEWVDNFNGTVTYYYYDNANRLTDLENKKSDSSIIAAYYFTLDANGNRTQIIKTEPLTPVLSLGTVDYTYNVERNRLLTAGGSSFSYDYEGQLTSKSGTAYAFDYEHRLKSIGSTDQFYYDGNDTRLKAVRNGVETRYVYDASGNLLAEADSNNVITGYYIHGAGLLAMVTPANDVYTYHFDAIGSTIAMTDQNQTLVNAYAYTPFGIIANEVVNVPQPFKFVGQHGVMVEQDGSYYMQARYYDPEVGRFISEDPSGFEGGINLYAYASNNPILLIDPEGLWTLQFGVSTTGGAGGGATYGRGIVFGHSEENGWQFGLYDTVGAGGYGGVSGGASINVTWSGNRNINDLSGIDATVGGSGGIGMEAGFEVGISRGGGRSSYTGSIGIGGGPVPVEMHGFVTNTNIREVWSSKKGK